MYTCTCPPRHSEHLSSPPDPVVRTGGAGPSGGGRRAGGEGDFRKGHGSPGPPSPRVPANHAGFQQVRPTSGPGGEIRGQGWPQTGRTCLATWPGLTPGTSAPTALPTASPGHCRSIPGPCWDAAGRELRGHLTQALHSEEEAEAPGGDAGLRRAQRTRARLASRRLDPPGGP